LAAVRLPPLPMPIFKYTVTNKESKKLIGSIEAPDEKAARSELNNLGFSILELTETQPEETTAKGQAQKTLDTSKKATKKFEFEAINPQGQKIIGTIAADDDFSGFKRLTKEYELTVTSIWDKDATEEEKSQSRAKGVTHLQEMLESEKETKKIKETRGSQNQRKKELFVKTKIEFILKQVNETLQEYGNDIPLDARKNIDKRIDKLLRIKHSTNFEYIIQTAEDLLKEIQKQEIILKKKGFLDKRARLILKVKDLLGKLHDTGKPKSISQDIVQNIQEWQQKNIGKATRIPWHIRLANKILLKVRRIFEIPPEIQLLKGQIKTCNVQILEYVKLYLREPTPQYKEKTLTAIKAIWERRKNAKKELKNVKNRIKLDRTKNLNLEEREKFKQDLFTKITGEITEFTGWLLAFYLIYYFISLYITSKNFGLGDPSTFPKSLDFYHTQIFKYVLVIVFLLHLGFTIKYNFFKKNKFSSLVIFPSTVFLIIFVLVNF